MLHRPLRARERILLMGTFGAGKSYAWCQTALWLRRSKSPAKVYVVDTDHAAEKLAEEYGEDFWQNVVSTDVWEYPEALAALQSYRQKATREDILVVDLADKLWAMSQDYFIEEAFGKNASSFYMEFKRAGQTGNALSAEAGYGANWQIINAHYADLTKEILRWPGHVICCTPADPIQKPSGSGGGGDSKEILALYERCGFKPAGQKNLGFQFFTVMLLMPSRNKWTWQTVKDVGRINKVSNGDMNDFAMDYLIPVAGWTMEGEPGG